ncbi:hypothetical protein D3C87_1976600 [compost metagenome]
MSKGVSMAGSTRNGAIDIVPPTANTEPAKPRQLLRTAIDSHSAMPSAWRDWNSQTEVGRFIGAPAFLNIKDYSLILTYPPAGAQSPSRKVERMP